MTAEALERLTEAPGGFVLVIYAGGPGRAFDQLLRGPELIAELAELDATVATALRFAEEQGDTAVIATSLRGGTLSVLDNHYGFHAGLCGVTERCEGPETFADIAVDLSRIAHGAGLSDRALQGEFTPPSLLLQYAWITQAAHNETGEPGRRGANFVPLFAYGPGTEAIPTFAHQAEIGQLLKGFIRSER
jgi:hypothetical protein